MTLETVFALPKPLWSSLNTQQLGRYAEYLVKMIFVRYGLDVYASEVDDRGIDFVVRTKAGEHVDVQVKALLKGNYVFMKKAYFTPRNNLFLALVRFSDAQEPTLYMIPSNMWLKPGGIFVGRDYDGKKSAPEWGINLSTAGWKEIERFIFAGNHLTAV